MKYTLEPIIIKPFNILLGLFLLLIPLWISEWGPLPVQLSGTIDIIHIDKQTRQLVAPGKTYVISPPRRSVPITQKVIISAGDTLMKISTSVGVPSSLAYRAIRSLSKIYDPKNILPGQEITFIFKPALTSPSETQPGQKTDLTSIAFRPDAYREFIITRDRQDQFKAKLLTRPTKTEIVLIKGQINSSLYLAAIKSGMPVGILMDMIRIYSWDIDFQRSIRSGDKFELLYEARVTTSGILTGYGDILYANLKLGKLSYPLYRFHSKNGLVNFFDSKGHSAKKALMRTPINGARLSSRFGTRRHPILGFNKMHRGVDFAAPSGTPIFAAGSGTVVYRARNGSYGNYIRIRHNSQYSTAYGHLSKFHRNVTKGSRVRQGQTIGYVGTTGRSTGAHLHYEILKRGRQTNPMRVKMPSGKHLKGLELTKFYVTKNKILKQITNKTIKALPLTANLPNNQN